MYIHLGGNTLIRSEDIIGIFDIDKVTVKKDSRDFLKKAEKSGQVVNVSYELPRSFVVSSNKQKKSKVYITQLSPKTLEKRANNKTFVLG